MRHQIQEDNGDHRSVQIAMAKSGKLLRLECQASLLQVELLALPPRLGLHLLLHLNQIHRMEGFPLIPSVSEWFARRTPV